MKYRLFSLRTWMIAWFAVTHLFLPTVAQANSGPPFRNGQFGAEPIGVDFIGISHETLHIDMRPLARNKLVNVEVMYELDNAGNTQQLELLFVTGANYVENFHVWLGEVELSTETSAVNIDELPPSWKPPTITPKIDSEQSNAYPNYYTDLPTQLVKFSAEIPSGKSQLKVAYQALAAQSYQVVVNWHFAYVLAPARSWASFGSLDVTVDVPNGWKVATTPHLSRTGNVLNGSFDGLPADAIALTVRESFWLYDSMRVVLYVLCGIVGIVGILLSMGLHPFGFMRKYRTASFTFLAALFSGLALTISGWLALYLPGLIGLGNQLAPVGYGQTMMAMFIGIGGLIAIGVYLLIAAATQGIKKFKDAS